MEHPVYGWLYPPLVIELAREAGAGGDSRTTLRYLSRNKATRLRDYLLARAHGDRATIESTGALPEASAFTDLGAGDRKLVTITPALLIKGMLLSTEFLVLALIALVTLIVGLILGRAFVSVIGVLPVLIFGVINLGRRRVLAQFNYTLAESARGLRITRGLTDLTSQSLPLDRIQGVRVSRPLLWRRYGWSRIDVDVLGYGATGEAGDSTGEVSSILLPVATDDQTRLALSRVLPGADPDTIELHPSPRRARAIRWFTGWTMRYGWNDAVVASRIGFLDQTTDLVPHGKTQSVRITRGPLQRRLRLASVHVDTPKGPVQLVARHLDPGTARDLAMTQLDRARDARRAARELRTVHSDAAVLRRFGIPDAEPLGSGGESTVYPIDAEQVLRIYHPTHEAGEEMIKQLQPAYREFAKHQLGFATPLIIEHGETAGRTYSIDRRIPGMSMSAWLPGAEEADRRAILSNYLQVAAAIRRLPLPAPGFARLFGDDRRSFPTLGDLLEDQLRTAAGKVREWIGVELPETAVERVLDEVRRRVCDPALVHGDFYPGNVYVGEQYGRRMITGVGDFSPHTLAADPVMDLAGAVHLLGYEDYDGVDGDQRWLLARTLESYGPLVEDLEHWLDVYQRYYAIYYAPDPQIYPRSLALLTS